MRGSSNDGRARVLALAKRAFPGEAVEVLETGQLLEVLVSGRMKNSAWSARDTWALLSDMLETAVATKQGGGADELLAQARALAAAFRG